MGGTARARSERLRYLPAIVACLGIGALTLLVLPTDLAYDPWSWLIWGRELDHLTLSTRGSGSAFKPLAAFIDVIIAPAGREAPELWTAFVRGATALSMVLAFDIARRLQGVSAGILAALALVTIQGLSSGLALHGMAEPLELCCCLAAVERGLAARPRAATWWLVAASMLELELIAALVLWGLLLIWLAESRGRAAAQVVLLVAVVVFVWILPGVLAGHSALHAEAAAAANSAAGPLRAQVPAWATLQEIWTMLLWPLALGWLAELVVGAVWFMCRRVLRPLFIPALIAALFVVGVAGLAQLHAAAGTSRFLVAACGVGVVAAVCLWVEQTRIVARALARWASTRVSAGEARRRGGPGAAVFTKIVVALGVLALVQGGIAGWGASVSKGIDNSRPGAQAAKRLPAAISAAGGSTALLACGKVYTGLYDVPEVAWVLNVPMPRIWHGPVLRPEGTVVSPRSFPVVVGQAGRYRLLSGGRAPDWTWQIYSVCPRRGRR